MTYPQALQQLQYWLTNSQASHANHLNFNAHPLFAAELQAIREYTQNRLPESYYLFLQQCGTGDFFYSWYTSVIDQTVSQTPKIEIYNLTQLKEENIYYQQLLREELDDIPPDEHPDIGEIFIIGAHHSMGDWFGFDLSRAEPNFDILSTMPLIPPPMPKKPNGGVLKTGSFVAWKAREKIRFKQAVASVVGYLYPTKSLILPSLQSIAAMPKMSDSRIRPTPSLLSAAYMDV